jgi:hypothetical protein
LVQLAVEVKHSRFYCYGSESGDSDKSICSSPRHEDGTKTDTWVIKKKKVQRGIGP